METHGQGPRQRPPGSPSSTPGGAGVWASHLGLCPDAMRSQGVSVLGDGNAQSIVSQGHLEDK